MYNKSRAKNIKSNLDNPDKASWIEKVLPRFELGFPDLKSEVLTITPQKLV